MLEEKPKLTKERFLVLALWFGVLVGIRVILGFPLQNLWVGTVGAVAITFAIFYFSLRISALGKFRVLINTALAIWYRRRFFYVTGAASMLMLASLLVLIEYGYSNYGDRLITMNMSEEELEEKLRLLSGDSFPTGDLPQKLAKYSALDTMAITLASADKNFEGYYSRIVGFMFAEDIEIMLFMTIFRSRKEIFSAPRITES